MAGATPARNQVLLMAVLLGLTGCGSTEPGRAVPMPGAGPSEPFQRPRELSLDGVDPCSLLSSAQLDELGVNSRPRESGRSCSFDVDRIPPYYSHVLETITDADLHAWIDREYASGHGASRTGEVAGYPSVTRYRDRGTPADCETLVGVAQGRTLRSQLYRATGTVDQLGTALSAVQPRRRVRRKLRSPVTPSTSRSCAPCRRRPRRSRCGPSERRAE